MRIEYADNFDNILAGHKVLNGLEIFKDQKEVNDCNVVDQSGSIWSLKIAPQSWSSWPILRYLMVAKSSTISR